MPSIETSRALQYKVLAIALAVGCFVASQAHYGSWIFRALAATVLCFVGGLLGGGIGEHSEGKLQVLPAATIGILVVAILLLTAALQR